MMRIHSYFGLTLGDRPHRHRRLRKPLRTALRIASFPAAMALLYLFVWWIARMSLP